VSLETENSDFPQFDWSPQIYQMDLNFSNVFFLWLHAGVAADQGKPEPISVSSFFFNITNPSSPSSATSTTSTKATASSVYNPQTTSATTAVTTTAASQPAPTNTSDSTPDSKSPPLSTGAQAGIGVGVSIAGLAALVCAVLLFIRWKRKHRQDRAGHGHMQAEPWNGSDRKAMSSIQLRNQLPVEMDSSYNSSQNHAHGLDTSRDPVELG
jgi:hypothetical protein